MVKNQSEANESLRTFQIQFPKRKIINVSMTPIDFPAGWFMVITYEVDKT